MLDYLVVNNSYCYWPWPNIVLLLSYQATNNIDLQYTEHLLKLKMVCNCNHNYCMKLIEIVMLIGFKNELIIIDY